MLKLLVNSSKPCCPSGCRLPTVRFGLFRRKGDQAIIQRYRCRCGRTFSDASNHPWFGQKKRHLNEFIFRLLSGGYSQRRSAFDLRINRKTVHRRSTPHFQFDRGQLI